MKIVMCIFVIIGLIFTPLNLIDGNTIGVVSGAMSIISGVVGLLLE